MQNSMQYYIVNHPQVVPTQAPQKQSYQDKNLGTFNISFLILFFSFLAGSVIIITWIIAAVDKDVPWFPVMITDTAKDYPQDIIFRIGMLFPIFFWMIQIFIIYWWATEENGRLGHPTSVPFDINYIPWVGLFCYSITIATVDNCEMNNTLHGACAVIFFICLVFYTWLMTYIIYKIREVNKDFISDISWYMKVVLAFAQIITVAALIAKLLGQEWGLPVAEWVATFIVLTYLGSFCIDFKNYTFVVDDEKGIHLVKIDPQTTNQTVLNQSSSSQLLTPASNAEYEMGHFINPIQNVNNNVQLRHVVNQPVYLTHMHQLQQHPGLLIGTPINN